MQRGKAYIIRHGQTDWNKSYKLQGQTDIELNENGRKMAREACEKYKDINIDVCYSSPLSRAYETAELVLENRHIPIIKDERLKEMSFGQYEGAQRVLEQAEHPIYNFFKDPKNYEVSGGAESIEDLYTRTKDFIDKILMPEIESGKNVLIVGHGAMNLSIVNQLMNIPVDHFWDKMLKNCELMEIEL